MNKKHTKSTQKNTPWHNFTTSHKAAFHSAIQRLLLTPIAALLTILVVGVALSLPSAFQILVNNLESGQQSIDAQSRISLYLTVNTSEADIKRLKIQINAEPDINEIQFISAAQGLTDFQKNTKLGNALSYIDQNPLPAVIHVFPNVNQLNPEQIEKISERLATFPNVDSAQIDALWLKQLFAITQFVKQIALAISLFLIFVVLIVIGNTIKLLGQDFHEEITVSKLVGATDAYVRRPFLYSGIIYGALGSAFALSLILIGLLWLNPQIEAIGQLYQTQIVLTGLSFSDVITIFSTGMILGLGGAWVSSNRLIHSLSI